MKRWILTLDGFNNQPKIYAESAEKAAQVFKNENVISVEPYTDTSFMAAIAEITNKSELLATQNFPNNISRYWYQYKISGGILRFRLYKDMRDGNYYDIAEYQYMSSSSLIYPCTFTYSSPDKVYSLFFTEPLSCEIASYRFYGEPKLSKPKELKGIKPSFSVDWIQGRCSCQCFLKDKDVWIKHRDFFSSSHKPAPEDIGTPLAYRAKKYFGLDLSYKDKFAYADCWGDIVFRNEAWIVFHNFTDMFARGEKFPIQPLIKAFLNCDVLKQSGIFKLCNDWNQFFERLCGEYLKVKDKNERLYKKEIIK